MPTSPITDGDVAPDALEVCPPKFVARDAQLARLSRALSRSPAVVLVEGEAGIGKSRLVREFLASRGGSRRRVLLTVCPPFLQPCTLGPVTDAVRQAADDMGGLRLSGLAGALRPLFPEWADVLPAAPDPLDDASASRHRLYRALAELLDRLHVVTLVAEDVHWADEATMEFLLFLATRPHQKISLLVTWRPEDLPDSSLLRRLSSRLPAGTTCERITLDPLDVSGTAEFISSMLPGGQTSEEFAKLLHTHTDGLPLAVEESVRLLRDRRDLRRQGHAWVRRRLDALTVPPSVQDAVLERFARLEPAAQRMLQAAATFAEPSTAPMLMSVSGLSDEDAECGLADALGCGLVEEPLNAPGLITFRHALAARAIHEALPNQLRRRLHLSAAHALSGVSPLPVVRLARHYQEAGDAENWCRYAEQAADYALAAGDYKTASAQIHQLLADGELAAPTILRLLRRASLVTLSGFGQLSDILSRLRTVVNDPAISAAERAEAGSQLGRALLSAGEYESATAELERAIPGLLAHQPVEAAKAMILLSLPQQSMLPVSVHRDWLDRAAAAMVGSAIPARDRLAFLADRASVLLALGEEAGWSVAAELPGHPSTPQERPPIARGHMNIAEMAVKWGRYQEARQRLMAGLALAEQHDYLPLRTQVQITLIHLDWFTGDWANLAERADALAGLDDIDPLSRAEAILVCGLLDAAMGSCEGARDKLRHVLEERKRRGVVTMPFEPAAALGRMHLRAGCTEEALQLTDEPMHVIAVKEIWLWGTEILPVRVEALGTSGREAEAAKLVTAFARGLGARDAPAPRASLALCRGLLMEARGEHARAAALFARAADAWRAMPRPYDALLTQERQARCLTISGQLETGQAMLIEVLRGFSQLGAKGDATQVAGRLREQGIAAWPAWRGGKRGYGDQLSPREAEVVRLVAAGHTNREIGEALCRSTHTITTQLKSAMRKFGVSSRTALAMRAAEAGITAAGQSPDHAGDSPVPG